MYIQAFRIAEALSVPVMVCMDGFILTHATERIDMPSQEEVDRFLPPFEPRQVLDPAEPVSIGAMVGPEAFMEVRWLGHRKQLEALELIPQVAAEFREIFGRDSGGLLRSYRTEDAETIVVALGSVNGTIQETVDALRDDGMKIGSVAITSFRPFPIVPLRVALRRARRVVVLDKSLAPGIGGILSDGVRKALSGIVLKGYTVIAGLGGRAITQASLARLFTAASRDELDAVTFLDLNRELVVGELQRERGQRRSGPTAEALLRQLGAAGSRVAG